MKKIIVVFDGAHFAEGAMNYVNTINNEAPVLAIGLFLPSIDYAEMLTFYSAGIAGPLYVPSIDTEANDIFANVEKFKAYCIKHNIEHRVHDTINGGVVEVLRNESRYADLILLSSDLFYENLGEISKQEYIEDTLKATECPVLLLPENYKTPASVVMAYDGTTSSIHAIKQFAYTMKEWVGVPTTIVYASDKDDDIPELPMLKEYASRHFSDLTFLKLEANPNKYFETWLQNKGAAMLVTGAYGKRTLTGSFKKHFLQEIIAEYKLPIFIAHK